MIRRTVPTLLLLATGACTTTVLQASLSPKDMELATTEVAEGKEVEIVLSQ